MTRVDLRIETCLCHVCRSDLAYLVPCEITDAPRGILEPVEEIRPAMVEIFPIPLMM